MFASSLLCAVLVSPCIWHFAHAGSRVWQPAVKVPRNLAMMDSPLDTDFGSNITTIQEEKRWIGLDPINTWNRAAKPWPDKTIKYCWADQKSKDELSKIFDNAKDLWYANDLPADFKYRELPEDNGICKVYQGAGRPDGYLRIELGDAYSTSIGYVPFGERHESDMLLTLKEGLGHPDAVVNVAHEIGHAWGLYHEHQDRRFWGHLRREADRTFDMNTGLAILTDDASATFGNAANPFRCKQLKDFEKTWTYLQSNPADIPVEYRSLAPEELLRKACTCQRVAGSLDFSAFDFLPLEYGGQRSDKIISAVGSQVDLDSLMLYPSTAGGIDLGGGRTDTVLLMPGGQIIEEVSAPNKWDVEGIKIIYDYSTPQDFTAYGDQRSAFRAKFDSVRRKLHDSSCHPQKKNKLKKSKKVKRSEDGRGL